MTNPGKSARQKKLPSYLLHKASGQARVRIDGHDFYLGPYGSEESRIEYGKLISQHASGAPIDPLKKTGDDDPGLTVAALALAYLQHAETYYVKNGAQTHEVSCIKSALTHLTKTFGLIPANEFGALKLKTVRQSMVDSGRMCRKFINGCVGRIRRCFKWGSENELVDAAVNARLACVAPLMAGRTEAIDHEPRSVVPRESIDAVRAVVPQRTRDMIDLQLLCGARPGELCMLTSGMIDQTTYQDQGVWFVKLDDHKMIHKGKERVLVFGPQSQLILRRYIHADPERKLFDLTRESYSLAIRVACIKLKIKRWTAHWLRHNFASQCRKDTNLDTTQQMLGHSDAATTQGYAHLDLKDSIMYARDAG
ncbi:MAG: site-specific tyrosine recombinase [Planctomycetaceae bacterium]|nr:site-specific tyrosine recombinase [Planctomycetaceae bacterium]